MFFFMLVGDLEEQRNFLLVTGVCKMHFYRQHGVNVSRDDNASHDSWNVILLQCSRGYYSGGCKASTIKHHFLLGKMNYVYSLAAFGRFQGRENNLIGEITCHYMFCFIFCMTNQDY